MRLALVALLLAGCNDLLGIGEPTLAPLDPASPNCATGWHQLVSIAIENDSPSELHDYQLELHVDTAIATRPDLRFVVPGGAGALAHAVEPGAGTSIVWVAVPAIPIGASEIEMYFDNPDAPPAPTTSPFVPDIIANPSFESGGGWSGVSSVGIPANVMFDSSGWASDGQGSLLMDLEVNIERVSNTQSMISQQAMFPLGTDYALRFDVFVRAASNGGTNDSNDGGFGIVLGDGVFDLWTLVARTNITGAHLDEETASFAPGSNLISITIRVGAGSGAADAMAFFDNLRVRKVASPEPVATVGDAVACP